MIRTRRVQLSSTLGSATILVPKHGLGFWRATGVTLRGWVDRRANRGVADQTPTHSVILWNRRFEQVETEALRHGYKLLRALDVEIVRCRQLQGESVEAEVPMPTVEELTHLTGRDRARWAESRRAAKRASAARAGAAKRIEEAASREAVLAQDRIGVVEELEIARAEWGRVFEERATRYTRSRFGGRKAVVATVPSAPDYRHTTDRALVGSGSVTNTEIIDLTTEDS